MNVLLAYASAHGSTGEVARFIGDLLSQQGFKTHVESVESITSISEFDAVVAGTAIHGGNWLPAMNRFIAENRTPLKTLPLYAWATCIRVLEPGGYEHAREHYMRRILASNLNVRSYEVFAGRIRREDVNINDRWTLSLRYDGRINTAYLNGDYRDWEKVTAWTLNVSGDLKALSTHKS